MMKTLKSFIIALLLFISGTSSNFLLAGNNPVEVVKSSSKDVVQAFKDRLTMLTKNFGSGLYAIHFQSIIDVIDSKQKLTATDSAYIGTCLNVFSDTATIANASMVSSYLDRSRYLTIAWNSPTDGALSFFRLRLPKDWDKNQSYPLYVDLHGLSSTADNPIDFLTRYYRDLPDPTIAFEDGYHIAPLARGNLWYYGISETDVWEAIDLMENMFTIDPQRKYLVGHSMGGFGTWMIASKSPEVWAAIGIEAGALWYDASALSDERIQSLSQLPTYFVVGTSDGLYNENLRAYNLLLEAGDPGLAFVTFNGGHEKLTPNVENMYLWIREFVNDDYNSSPSLDSRSTNSLQVSPNPVTGRATFTLNLKQPDKVSVALYDITGTIVSVICDETMESGKHLINWQRNSLPAGIYICSFATSNGQQCGKLILR
jgi:pimeloyl-ACP methyl ester carboxylesterase